jgi:hydantoinase/carbamoylase family amidase
LQQAKSKPGTELNCNKRNRRSIAHNDDALRFRLLQFNSVPVSSPVSAVSLLESLDLLARHSDAADQYTRTYLTPAHQAAAARIEQWMREAGLEVRTDAVGSVIGRYEATTRGAKTLLMGSHFDSVRNGGKYDGNLGILAPIECVARLARANERLPVALEIAAFADEEGARFQTSFLASRAMLDGGRHLRPILDRRDPDGVTLESALRSAGLDPARLDEARVDRARICAYVETHIEQGPVLLDAGKPLGVVTGIAGGTRHRVTVEGQAGHAGTVPMAMRHDALATAAEMVLAVERRCRDGSNLVGTVGVLEVANGTGNVIPGHVELTVDIRSADDRVREAAERDVFAAFDAIAGQRGVRIERVRTHHVHAVACDDALQDQLARAVAAVGVEPMRLPSGAGHDAMILAEAMPVGMLFVRCGAGGVSHNPAETITAEDAELAVQALSHFLRNFSSPA